MKKVFLLAALAFVSDASIAQNIDTTKREVFFSYSERDEINIEELLESVRSVELAKVKGSATPTSEAQALAVFKNMTQSTIPQGAASSEAEYRIAAVGALSENIDLAQACLLEAEKIKKNDPATRISMAGILISKGYPREAIALLGSASPAETVKLPGDRSLAAAWNLAKGVALLVLRNPQQAIPLLKKAVQQDQYLKEASISLAKAQIMAGDANGARQSLRQGAWRQRSTINWSKEGYGKLPYGKIYDLNRGQYRALEEILPPADSRQLMPFQKTLKELTEKVNGNIMSSLQAFTAAQSEYLSLKEKNADPMLEGRLAQISGHASEVLGKTMGISPLNSQWDPVQPPQFSYKDLKNDYSEDIELLRMRDGALSIKQAEMISNMLGYMDFVPNNTVLFNKAYEEAWNKLPQSYKSQEERIQKQCLTKIALNDRFLPAMNANMVQWDESAKDWYKTAWRLSTAITQHIPYGKEFESTKAYLEYTTWLIEMFRLNNWNLAYSGLADLSECEKYTGHSVPTPQKTAAQKKLEACNAFTSGISLKFKIQKPNKATLIEVGVSCEKISVKSDILQIVPGVVAVKGGVEWGPGKSGNGELTGLIGLSGKITDAVSGDINLYVTADMVTGEMIDWGVKGNVSGKEGLYENATAAGKTTLDRVGKADVTDAVVYVATGMMK